MVEFFLVRRRLRKWEMGKIIKCGMIGERRVGIVEREKPGDVVYLLIIWEWALSRSLPGKRGRMVQKFTV